LDVKVHGLKFQEHYLMKLFDYLLCEHVEKAICLFDYLFWCWI